MSFNAVVKVSLSQYSISYKTKESTSFFNSHTTNLFLFYSENLKTFIPEFILLLVYRKSDLRQNKCSESHELLLIKIRFNRIIYLYRMKTQTTTQSLVPESPIKRCHSSNILPFLYFLFKYPRKRNYLTIEIVKKFIQQIFPEYLLYALY